MPITSPGNDDDTGENHQPTLRKNTAEPVEQTLKQNNEWIRICEEHGLIRSMSAKGCSPDNAAAEGFFGRLKNELFYGRDWRGVGYEEFRERLAAYLTHYNETRIKKSLDWMSPVQYRRSLGLAA